MSKMKKIKNDQCAYNWAPKWESLIIHFFKTASCHHNNEGKPQRGFEQEVERSELESMNNRAVKWTHTKEIVWNLRVSNIIYMLLVFVSIVSYIFFTPRFKMMLCADPLRLMVCNRGLSQPACVCGPCQLGLDRLALLNL